MRISINGAFAENVSPNGETPDQDWSELPGNDKVGHLGRRDDARRLPYRA